DLVGNASFNLIDINSGTIAGGTLALNAIGTNTSNLRYAFPGGFTVAPGAALVVGPNVPVEITASQTLTDNGTLSFTAGDVVTLDGNCCGAGGAIAAAGLLSASGTTFNSGGVISINSGGRINATNDVFNSGPLSLASGSGGQLAADVF